MGRQVQIPGRYFDDNILRGWDEDAGFSQVGADAEAEDVQVRSQDNRRASLLEMD
jgi:hypothetical protein